MYSNNHLSKWIAFGLILVALVAMIGCNTSNRPAVKPELAGVNTQADAPQAAEVTKPDSAKSYADIVKAVEELDRSTSVLTGQITNAQTFINARPKDDVINRATVAELAEMISTKIVPAPVDPEAKKTMPVVAKEVAGYEIVADYRTDVADVIPFKITRLADGHNVWFNAALVLAYNGEPEPGQLTLSGVSRDAKATLALNGLGGRLIVEAVKAWRNNDVNAGNQTIGELRRQLEQNQARLRTLNAMKAAKERQMGY